MKKRMTALLLTLLFSLLPAQAAGNDAIAIDTYNEITRQYERGTALPAQLHLDGVPLETEVPALLVGGRTLAPVRAVAEALGATVLWAGASRQATIKIGEDTVVLTLGRATALVNGAEQPLPDGVPAAIIRYQGSACTMIPLRFLAEHFGATVSWDGSTRTANLLRPKPAALAVIDAVKADAALGTVLVSTTQNPRYQVSDLGNRVVLDVLDAALPAGAVGTREEAAIQVGTKQLTAVRYLQHGADFVAGSACTLRVVLDLPDGITWNEHVRLTRTDAGILLTVSPAETLPEYAYTQPKNPGNYTIAIDPGHGGDHYGANYEGIHEKNINLAVALKLRQRLTELGYQVVMTIEGDTTLGLYERCAVANAANADLFLSVHSNASNINTIQGLFTYYHPSSNRSKALAKIIQAPACEVTGAIDRGILSADFVVVRETQMPAVLVEMGFMSSHEELMRLIDPEYQQKLALGIAEGAVRYLNTLQ